MNEFYEGIEAGVPPVQVWCPRCEGTIIDPIVAGICAECEAEMNGILNTGTLQSEDRDARVRASPEGSDPRLPAERG